MIIYPVKTRVLLPPKDDLLSAIREALPKIKEKSILAVSSKAVGIWEGRCVPREKFPDRDVLAQKEADYYLPRSEVPGGWSLITIKKGVFVASAGIDKSNANGYYVLWPKDPGKSAKLLWQKLRKLYGVKELGIIIMDSHTVPFRRGVTGISIGYYGFAPLKDYREKRDIFGNKLVITQSNIPDGLAAPAVLLVGEGEERTPIAVIEDIPFVRFGAGKPSGARKFSSFEVPAKEDIYSSFLKKLPWRRGGGKNGGKNS